MDLIQNVLGYMRTLASNSADIKGFYVGEEYQSNNQYQEYPVLFVRLPLSYTYNQDKTWYTIDLKLCVYDNRNLDEYDNASQSTEFYQTSAIEQLNRTGNILNNVLQQIETEIHSSTWNFSILTVGLIETVTRVWNDDVNGVECNISLKVPFACMYEPILPNTLNNPQ